MAEGNPGHRPMAAILTANFTKVRQLNNKSQRWILSCNHCPQAPPTEIENRDNRCLIHLSTPQACPQAPEQVRRDARLALMGKGVPMGVEGPVLRDSASSTASNDAVSTSTAAAAVVQTTSKKRKVQNTLYGYVDTQPMNAEQQQIAHVKLFR